MDNNTQKILKELSAVYQSGSMADVEAFLVESADRLKPEDGEFAEDFILILNELGSFYRDTGRAREAITIFSTVKNLIETYIGNDTISFAIALMNIAASCRILGEDQRALKLFLQAAGIFSRQDSEGIYANTLTLNNIALIYEEEGRFAEAAEYFKRVLNILLGTKGETSIEKAITYANLAGVYKKLNENENAGEALSCAIGLADLYTAPPDITSIDMLKKVASAAKENGRTGEAETLYLKIIELCTKSYELADEYANACRELALLYMEDGDNETAETYMQRALDSYALLYGQTSDIYKDAEVALRRLQQL